MPRAFVPDKALLKKSQLWFGGNKWHALAMAAAEITAFNKGYRSIDPSKYREAGFQPDVVIERADKAVRGPKRRNILVRYAIEIVDTHGPSEDYSKKAALDDILTVERARMTNPDSIEELFDYCGRVIP